MPRTLGTLTHVSCAKATKPGNYSDGGGLYLQVSGAGAKSWIFRYSVNGKERYCGLGSFNAVSLAQAREKAAECRHLRSQGIDPIGQRQAARAQIALDAARAITFKDCAEAYIAAHEASWRNAVHRRQWRNTLAAFVFPVIGAFPVGAIDTALVMKVIEPLWNAKPETASRVRGRIEVILDWAKVRGYRNGENPARWRGHLDHLLPSKRKVRAVKHHAALPYADVPAFMTKLRSRQGVSARALEFLILTGARSGEAVGAKWDEVDLKAKTWKVPASRMKGGRPHRVPLSSAALAIVEGMAKIKQNEFIFPGQKLGRAITGASLSNLLDDLEHGDVTLHGFRSTFRDWSAERTNFPREVAEAALAHAIGNEVEAAYRRGDLFEKRRALMNAWAAYCASSPAASGDVVPLRRPEAVQVG